jgi:ATP-dependent helicase/nuclease subunit A
MALARLDLTKIARSVGDERRTLEQQLAAVRRQAWWGDAPPDPHIEEGIARFFESGLGHALVEAGHADRVEREVPFSLKWTVAELVRHRPELLVPDSIDPRWTRAQWDDVLDRYWVLLQGRIDCLFRSDEGFVLIDWKTDRVSSGGAEERAVQYRSQIDLYADAAVQLWGEPVRSFVVFLVTGSAIEITRRGRPVSLR